MVTDTEYKIWVKYNSEPAKTRTIYDSTDGPTGKPASNPHNHDGFGDFLQTVPAWSVWAYWSPGPPILTLYSSNLNRNLKWWFTTVADTWHRLCRSCIAIHSQWRSIHLCWIYTKPSTMALTISHEQRQHSNPTQWHLLHWKLQDIMSAASTAE